MPRVHRWWVYLQSFGFDVVYREKKLMILADFLSRNHFPSHQQTVPTVSIVERKHINFNELAPHWLAEQQRDPEITKSVDCLNNG